MVFIQGPQEILDSDNNWELFDDQTNDFIARLTGVGRPPSVGTHVRNAPECRSWIVTKVGEMTNDGLMPERIQVKWPIFGHCEE